MPSRPSGGNKEQEPAQREGSIGLSLTSSPFDRMKIAANRHAHPHRSKIAEKGKSRLIWDHDPCKYEPAPVQEPGCDRVKRWLGGRGYLGGPAGAFPGRFFVIRWRVVECRVGLFLAAIAKKEGP